MEITIYSKKRHRADGKDFYIYFSTLFRPDGSNQPVTVKFRECCGNPKPEKCPMNITFEKKDANLHSHEFVREDTGETGIQYTLWISDWTEGSPFIDHSLDEFV